MTRRLLLLLLLTVAGCAAVGPDYVAPEATVADSVDEFPSASLAGAVSAPVEARWWTQWDDAVLNELVGVALSENYDLHIAAANDIKNRCK